MKKVAAIVALFCMMVFAQSEQKIAVYVTGDIGTNEKKALITKLLSSFVNSGKYKSIEQADAFFNGLQDYEKNSALQDNQIITFGKQLGAQFVCLVGIMPAFDSYNVSAHIIDTETAGVILMGAAGSPLRTMDDLVNVSNELAIQLQLQVTSAPVAATAAAAAPKQCDKKYNINELLAKIQYGFPAQLSECSSTLVKEITLAKSPFAKKPAPEPSSYMTTCTMDGIKASLPEGFPSVDKIIGDTQKFLQNVLSSALAGGVPNPTKLVSAASDMSSLLGSIKNLASENECIVSEPYEYVAPVSNDNGGDSETKDRQILSLGFRGGTNFSYDMKFGWQAGLVLDIAPTRWFHIQPGVMYMMKNAEYEWWGRGYRYSEYTTTHNIEIPLLLSFKLAALRLNVGPYYNICLDPSSFDNDFGLTFGLGFDIWKFYIGTFNEFGFNNVSSSNNGTFGFNLGFNL